MLLLLLLLLLVVVVVVVAGILIVGFRYKPRIHERVSQAMCKVYHCWACGYPGCGRQRTLLWLACSAVCCGFVACRRCNHEIRIACELATLTLRDVRFVSVWGPRGVGKSSSALNVVQYVVTLLWHICCRCVNVWAASAWGGRAMYVSCPSVRCPVLCLFNSLSSSAASAPQRPSTSVVS